MTTRPESGRYDTLSIALHWLMLVLLVGVYACINLTDLYPRGSGERDVLKDRHFMLGLAVFALVAVRLLNRLRHRAPPVLPPLPQWQARLASAMHLALYGFMLAMPLLGWLTLSAQGKPIPFFGLHLPALLAQNKDLAHWLKEIHETIGTLGYFLIGGHAAAALYHHFITRDDTLVRMLPGRR